MKISDMPKRSIMPVISSRICRLDRYVERRGRLVGDQEMRDCSSSAIAIITRCRMPPENSWT